MAYATSVTMYRRRNHTVRVVVDLTIIPDLTGAILTMSIRTGAPTTAGTIVLTKTNASGDATQAAVVSADTVEFYLVPADTYDLSPGAYTADATVQTTSGLFQLLDPLSLTLLEPVTL